jgi:hypothetical protein
VAKIPVQSAHYIKFRYKVLLHLAATVIQKGLKTGIKFIELATVDIYQNRVSSEFCQQEKEARIQFRIRER